MKPLPSRLRGHIRRVVGGPVVGRAVALLAIGLASPLAQAQGAAAVPAPDPALPRVTVTGAADGLPRKAELGLLGTLSALEAPFSITGFDAQRVQNEMARTVTDLMVNDASMRVPAAADGVYDNFTIRGFQSTTSSHSLNGLYGVLPLQRMGLEGMERIEIIKGPTMLLTGAGPFGYAGGATNFIPKRAADAPLTAASLEVSGRGQTGLGVDVGRRFGPDESVGLRVNGIYRDGRTATDDQSERFGLATMALDWRGSGARATFDAGLQDYTIDHPTLGMTISPGIDVPAAPAAGSNPFPNWTQAAAKDYYGVLGGEVDLAPSVVAFAAVGARRDTSHVINAYMNIEDSAGNATVYPSYEPYAVSTHLSANGGVRGSFVTGQVTHRLAAMASVLRYQTGYTYTLDDYSFVSNLYNPVNGNVPRSFFDSPNYAPKAADYADSGVSVADEMAFLDGNLRVLVGLRYQHFEVDQFDVFTG